jgi:hypothetical protein
MSTLRSHLHFSFVCPSRFDVHFFNQRFQIDSAEGTERDGVQYVHLRVVKQIRWERLVGAVEEFNHCGENKITDLKRDDSAGSIIRESTVLRENYWTWKRSANLSAPDPIFGDKLTWLFRLIGTLAYTVAIRSEAGMRETLVPMLELTGKSVDEAEKTIMQPVLDVWGDGVVSFDLIRLLLV